MYRALIVLLFSLWLAACASTPEAPESEWLRAETPGRLPPVAGSDALFPLLAAELALQEAELDRAAHWYAEAASQSDDLEIAERAARIGLFASDAGVAARSVDRWLELDPEATGAAQAALGLALRRGDSDRASALGAALMEGQADGWRLVGQALAGHASEPVAGAVVEILADSPTLRQEHARLVGFSQLAQQLDRPALAVRLADESVERFPETSQVYVWRAQMRGSEGRQSEARDDFRRGLVLEPDNEDLRLGLAALLNEAGERDEAHALLQEVAQNETLRAARLALAAEAEDQPRLDALYQEMVADPALRADSDVHMLGQLAELLERPEPALGWYRQVSERGPLAQEVLLRQAVVLEQLDRLEEARAALEQRRESADLDRFALANTFLLEGEFLRKRGEYAAVVDLYTRALNRTGEETRLLYARALAAERIDQLDQAETDLRRLIELDPEDAHALNALGYTLTDRTDRHQEALGYIERALALLPDDPAIIDSMGWVKYRLGDLEAAERYLREAYARQPDGEVASHLGEVLWVRGDQARALEIWREGMLADPDNVPLRKTLERFSVDLGSP